jgi:hypothetical protein
MSNVIQDLSDEQTVADLNIIYRMTTELPLGLSLVWVWHWTVIQDLKKYPEDWRFEADDLTIFKTMNAQCEKEGFTLEYGAEEAYTHIIEWLQENKLVTNIELA